MSVGLCRQGVVGASTLEALEEAVQKYKLIAGQVEPHSDHAKDIIRRLVQLRMKLFEAKVLQYTQRHRNLLTLIKQFTVFVLAVNPLMPTVAIWVQL